MISHCITVFETTEWILRLTSLEKFNSIFKIANEKKYFEIYQHIKKEKRYFLEDIKLDGEIFPATIPKNELLRPVAFDKIKKKWFGDVIIKGKNYL